MCVNCKQMSQDMHFAPGYGFICDPDFVTESIRIWRSQGSDQGLSYLYAKVNSLALNNEFEVIDNTIKETDTEESPLDILLGVLTITLSMKNKLKNREKFFNDLNSHITDLSLDSYNLLQGLE